MAKTGKWAPLLMRIATSLCAIGIATSGFARTSLEEEKVCPYDGVKFRFIGQGSGTSFGQQLDFQQVGMITSPWPIAVCPTNGFVFYKSKFDETELEKLRPLVLSAEYQATKDETSYYRAFWLIDRSGGSHLLASETLLAATWQAGGDQYSRYAEELLARLPADIAASEGAERRKFIVLQGELLRRLKRFDDAAEHLRHWQLELGATSTEGLIAAYELQLIAQRDSEPHLVSDAIEAGERDLNVWVERRSPTPMDQAWVRTNFFKFPSLRTRPRFQWSIDGEALTGTEAPKTEYLWQRTDKNFVKFELSTGTQTIIKTPVNWAEIGRSKDGKTIWAIDHGDGQDKDAWRLLQIDSRSLEINKAAPVPSWTSQFAVSHDQMSFLVHAKEGLAAFDLGLDGLRPLRSPSFSVEPDRWKLIGADPSTPRIVVLHQKSLIVWDYEKGTVETQFQPKTWTAPSDAWAAQALYTADGRHLVVAASVENGSTYEISTWDLQSRELIYRLTVKDESCQLVSDGSRSLFALGCWKGVYVADQGYTSHFVKVLSAADGHPIEELAFSPDAKKLAARTMSALFVYSIRR